MQGFLHQLLSGVADGGIYASLALALMIAVTLAVLNPGVPFLPLYSSGIGDAGGSAESGVQSTGRHDGWQPPAEGWPLQLERWPE